MAALISPVYAPLSCSEQFSAPRPKSLSSMTSATGQRCVAGTQTTTPQLTGRPVRAALISLARATPSGTVVFIFQLPATIFFLIVFTY